MKNSWFGWPAVPALDNLVVEWVRANDQPQRRQLAADLQKLAFNQVTYVPWGEWVLPTALRKKVRDVVKFGAPIFWNVKVS